MQWWWRRQMVGFKNNTSRAGDVSCRFTILCRHHHHEKTNHIFLNWEWLWISYMYCDLGREARTPDSWVVIINSISDLILKTNIYKLFHQHKDNLCRAATVFLITKTFFLALHSPDHSQSYSSTTRSDHGIMIKLYILLKISKWKQNPSLLRTNISS